MLTININFSATCAIWFKEKEKRICINAINLYTAVTYAVTVQISLFMCPTHSLTFFLNSASNNRNIIKIKIIPGTMQSIKQYSITKYNGIRQCYDSSPHVH